MPYEYDSAVRLAKVPPEYTSTETRGVLGGAYKGKERELLTHLVFLKGDDEIGVGCRQPLGNIADHYSNPKGNSAKPTCPTCAKVYDRLSHHL